MFKNLSNLKYFWKFINDKKPKNNLPNLISFNNEETKDGQSIVNTFKKYFSSVYTQPLPNPNFTNNFSNSIPNISN